MKILCGDLTVAEFAKYVGIRPKQFGKAMGMDEGALMTRSLIYHNMALDDLINGQAYPAYAAWAQSEFGIQYRYSFVRRWVRRILNRGRLTPQVMTDCDRRRCLLRGVMANKDIQRDVCGIIQSRKMNDDELFAFAERALGWVNGA